MADEIRSYFSNLGHQVEESELIAEHIFQQFFKPPFFEFLEDSDCDEEMTQPQKAQLRKLLKKHPNVGYLASKHAQLPLETLIMDQYTLKKAMAQQGYGYVYSTDQTDSEANKIFVKVEFVLRPKSEIEEEAKAQNNAAQSGFAAPIKRRDVMKFTANTPYDYKPPLNIPFAISVMPGYLFTMERLTNKATKLEAEAVKKIMAQLLLGLKSVHGQGYTFNNLDPESIGFFVKSGSDITLKLLDFSKISKMSKINQKPLFDKSKLGYISRGCHSREPLTANDDLESLLFLAIRLSQGSAPWTQIAIETLNQVNAEMKAKKEEALSSENLEVLPEYLRRFANSILKTDADIDHDKLILDLLDSSNSDLQQALESANLKQIDFFESLLFSDQEFFNQEINEYRATLPAFDFSGLFQDQNLMRNSDQFTPYAGIPDHDCFYKGQWSTTNNKPHGEGTLITRAGWIYEGCFIDGSLSGAGRLITNNCYIKANFEGLNTTGTVQIVFRDNCHFEGTIRSDQGIMVGTLTQTDGVEHSGQFKQFSMQKQGVIKTKYVDGRTEFNNIYSISELEYLAQLNSTNAPAGESNHETSDDQNSSHEEEYEQIPDRTEAAELQAKEILATSKQM